jgi:hypothetical protein
MYQRKKFLTFGGPTQEYHNRVIKIKDQAKSLNFFDEIIGLTDIDLKNNHPIFWEKNGEFMMSNRRGYGFWLWKPYVILSTLQDSGPNDIIIYMDAGCTLNPNGKERLNDYIRILNSQTEVDIISFQMCALPEIKYTKRDLLTYLDVPVEDMKSGQCMATVIIMRKGEHSISVVNKWNELASIRDLINDKRNLEEYKFFIDHRHDQSIYSLLVKKYGSIKIPDETYFEPHWVANGIKYPFWATRIRY